MNTLKPQNIDEQRDNYEKLLVNLTTKLTTATTVVQRRKIQDDIDRLKTDYLDRRHRHDAAANYITTSEPITNPHSNKEAKAIRVEEKMQAMQEKQKLTGRKNLHSDGWVDVYDDEVRPSREEVEARRDLHDVLSATSRNPYKTNDRKDDMRYQTHGARNLRSKKRF